jgi:transposase
MSTRFVNVDRDTPLLLPPDLREWVPEDDLVHFVIASLTDMDLSLLKVNRRGTGSEQFPPRMMLGLLIYCYALGVFSSRRIERATWRDVGVRFLTGDTHPDHDTICTFRRENLDLIAQTFLEVLKLAREMGLLKVGTISVDGTHIRANASKHKNVGYARAGELEEQLKLDIAQLLEKAKEADAQGAVDPAELPQEIARRDKLREKMAKARAVLQEQARERAQAPREQYQRKMQERQERKDQGKGPGTGGGNLKEPDDKPGDKDQVNLTDADSRLMKKGFNGEYRQSYNPQVAVDAEGSMLIVAAGLTNCANDLQQLEPMIGAVASELGLVKAVLADTGYAGVEAMARLEQEREDKDGNKVPGVDLYVAIGTEQEQRRYDYRPREVLDKPRREPVDARLAAMREKLRTPEGRRMYAKRKETVEPVFGIIKQAMGFRQFLLRGLEKVTGEWSLVGLAYNIRRLWSLTQMQAR